MVEEFTEWLMRYTPRQRLVIGAKLGSASTLATFGFCNLCGCTFKTGCRCAAASEDDSNA